MGYSSMSNSDDWSKKAYQRSKDATTAYNYALVRKREGDLEGFKRLMEESLRHNPEYDVALTILGHHLLTRGDAAGTTYLEQACALYEAELKEGELSSDDCRRLGRVAKTLGRSGLIAALEQYERSNKNMRSSINERYLVEADSQPELDIN